VSANVRATSFFTGISALVVAIVPGAATATTTTCTTSAVCAEYINTYTYSSGANTGGVAIHGEANSGIGVRGTSVTNVGFYGASGSGTVVAPGVEGESSQPGSGAGAAFGLAAVFGPANAPATGIYGYGLVHGAFGAETSAGASASAAGYGIFGSDFGGTAGGAGDYNDGVYGVSATGTAMLAEASRTGPAAGIYGTAPVGVYSVASTQSGTPVNTAYAFVGESDSVGLALFRSTRGESTDVNYGTSSFLSGYYGNAGQFYIDYNGNERISGTLTTSKGTYVRTTGRSGAAVREYAARGATPNVEDFGEARLSNGRAFVPIDARFGDTIDRRVPYLVFVTPEGDGNALFVTQKTPAGFVVRETDGGRSSLAFEYRIVARPIGETGARLEAMATNPLANEIAREESRKPEQLPRPLTPLERMREELAPARFASAMSALRTRLEAIR
jgi:hypothetical protein